MLRERQWILAGMTVLTILLCLAIAFDVSPYLRGPAEWRWHFAIPSRPVHHIIPIFVVITYVAGTMLWTRRLLRRNIGGWERRAFLLFVILSVPVIQASLYTVEDPDLLEQPFYRTVSPTSSGVFTVGSAINEPIAFLRDYPERMPTFPTHPQRYPPGIPLLFYGVRRVLEHVPAVSEAIASRLRLYQCHNLTLMSLPNEAIASSLLQVMLPVVSGLIALPIYGLARRAMGEREALWAVTLYPLVPSFNLWFARWDAFYALLAATIWLLFYIGLVEFRNLYLAASGVLLSAASFLSFGNLALLLPLGCWALLWLVTHWGSWAWSRPLSAVLVFGAGCASLWILYRIALGTGFFDIWRVSMSYHLGLERNYWVWLGYHVYDFFSFLGLPVTLLFVLSLVMGARDVACQQGALLPIGFAFGFLLLDLSGMSQGEVARVWLFLTPFAALGAAYGMARLHTRPVHTAIVFSLLATQLLTFNAFLRVVTTGLYDPPDRERIFSAPSIAHPQKARVGDRINLLGHDLEAKRIKQGETIHLTLYWQPVAPISEPYTVFTHLIDSDGRLVAQQDNMPVDGTVPTTCWVPGEVVVDQYDIAVGPGVRPGRYRLQTGLYRLGTGERLPSEGETATGDGRVMLTQVSVGEK